MLLHDGRQERGWTHRPRLGLQCWCLLLVLSATGCHLVLPYRGGSADRGPTDRGPAESDLSVVIEGGPPLSLGLPGGGDIQAVNSLILGDKLLQTCWRNNLGFSRKVPFTADGRPDWDNGSLWTQAHDASRWPGEGKLLSDSTFLFPPKCPDLSPSVCQGYFRGDEGHFRFVALQDSVIDWNDATGWYFDDAKNHPTTGIMRAQSACLLPSGELYQAQWRSNDHWSHIVPMDQNGCPAWASAPWQLSKQFALPGTGDLQALDDVVLPYDRELMQTVWQGNKGFIRFVPLKPDQPPDLESAGDWSGPWLP